jgi:hypothetical protein
MANWQTAMANSYGKTAKNIIIRLIIVAIGVCHDNSAKADLQKYALEEVVPWQIAMDT